VRVPGSLDALRLECEGISRVVLALPEEDFARPVRRTPAWNVMQLLGHMYRDLDRIVVGLAEDPPGEPDADAVSYWRTYDPAVDGVSIAERSKARAASYRSGHELAVVWDDFWRHALDLAEGRPSGGPFMTWGPVMTFDEFLKTRVIEITVHGLDLADALGRRPWASDEGMTVTREVLAGLLGQKPPAGLGWSDMTFIEKGTGRVPLTDADRGVLGRLADRFPLLA
jgi:uncharacterized protein (TIGR03083 family)